MRWVASRLLLLVVVAVSLAALCDAIPSSLSGVARKARLVEQGEWIDMNRPVSSGVDLSSITEQVMDASDLEQLDGPLRLEPPSMDELARFVEERKPINVKESCLSIPNTLCIGDEISGGTTLLLGDATPKGVVGRWLFDDTFGLDSSRRFNHIHPPPSNGPGVVHGNCAYFSGSDRHVIPHHPDYSSDSMTVSLWLFLIEDIVGEGFRTIFHKGDETTFAPSLSIFPDSRKLHMVVTTSKNRQHAVDSRSSIPLRRWTHLAVTIDHRLVQLFINGVMDMEFLLPSKFVHTQHPIYVASDPMRPFGLKCLMDNLELRSVAAPLEELRDIGSSAFVGVASHNVDFGCNNCNLFKALKETCKTGYHLCSEDELYGAGYLNVARTLGWVVLSESPKVWHRDSVDATGATGVGLCCRD